MNDITETLNDIWIFLEDIIIIKEYEINPDDDLITQTKSFILRYRRIIGFFILILLLSIWKSCNFNIQKTITKTINKTDDGTANSSPKNITTDKPSGNRVGIDMEEKVQKGGAVMAAAPIAGAVGRLAPTIASSVAPAILEQAVEKEGARKSLSLMGKMNAKATLKSKATLNAFNASKAGETLEKFKGKSGMGKAGMVFGGVGKGIYGAGAYAGEKFKEFSGWLYEILFAIALSIAICMLIVPSIAFIILGIVCFFLLRKQISGLKGL